MASDNETPDQKLIDDAVKSLKECIDEEFIERGKMADDLRFCTLDQWPREIRNQREDPNQEGGPRPCLTTDKSNQYIVQIVNDMRQGKPGINVRPQDDTADVETAKILKGLIRNIEDQSKADIAYSTGGESAVKIGLGYWRVTTEYVSPDSFDQEIFIRPVPNTFSVYLGPHIMPDGSDAKKGFIIETMPLEKFKREFPGKKWAPDDFSGLGDNVSQWRTTETITVVEYYCLERENETLLSLADGTTITETQYKKWPATAGPKPAETGRRSSYVEKLKWAKMTGIEILDRRDLPGKYIPIIEMIGRESWCDGKRVLWGVVRPAKDPLRMDNYIASSIIEKMGLGPKQPYIGAKGQFKGVEDKWKKANQVNYAYLEYDPIDVNGNALPRPERQGAMPMEVAMVNYRQMIKEDVREALGMFKASVGDTESQQSGRAILALQHESDTGTYHFGANQGVSIRHTGVVILDLIPHYYDTKRIVRIIGEDGTVQTAQIDPEQQEAHRKVQGPNGIQSIYNPGVGKYDVAISVGPSYATKRMEAAATLTEVVKSQPQLMPLIGDLLFRSLDFPYSDQIAERLKKMLPPPLQDSAGDPGVKLMQAMQKMQQMGAQMQEMSQENMQLKAGAQAKMAAVQVDDNALKEKARLAREEANASLTLQKEKQDKEAQLARDKALDEFLLKQECERRDCEHAKEMQDKKHGLERERLDFEKQCHAEEKMAETKSESETQAAEIAPKLVESMQAIVAEFAQVIQGQQAFQQQIVAELSKKKTITAKSSSGMTMSATVN